MNTENRTNKRVWLTWFDHTRSENLSRAFNADYLVLPNTRGRLGKYLLGLIWTPYVLIRRRPDHCFVQAPSIGAAATAIVLGKLLRHKTVIDFHNAGFRPMEGRSKFLNWFCDWLAKSCFFCIVTNDELARELRSVGASAFTLPDATPIPQFGDNIDDHGKDVDDSQLPRITVVSSWAEDEPIEEILCAAGKLDGTATFGFTGKPPEHIKGAKLPPNVELLGYVSKSQYWRRLKTSSLVIDLTLRDNCLVCGAYESLAVGTPMLLSDKLALREYFGGAAQFTTNDCEAIANKTTEILSNLGAERERVSAARESIQTRWNNHYTKIATEYLGDQVDKQS